MPLPHLLGLDAYCYANQYTTRRLEPRSQARSALRFQDSPRAPGFMMPSGSSDCLMPLIRSSAGALRAVW